MPPLHSSPAFSDQLSFCLEFPNILFTLNIKHLVSATSPDGPMPKRFCKSVGWTKIKPSVANLSGIEVSFWSGDHLVVLRQENKFVECKGDTYL